MRFAELTPILYGKISPYVASHSMLYDADARDLRPDEGFGLAA